jgi:regulator of protease activity HflC (stomatin/prohibitin superfamily)
MVELVLKLIEFLSTWFWYISPLVVCGDDECGLIRRRGIYVRELDHGFNWKIPILETHMVTCSALESTMLREQTLTTSDNAQVTIRGVLSYRVINPRRYILDCATAASVINDVGCAVIAEQVPGLKSSTVLRGKLFTKRLLRAMRMRARKWGIEVLSVGLADRVHTRTYRLFNSNSNSAHTDGL